MRLTKTTHHEDGVGLVKVPMSIEEYRESCSHHYRESVDFFGRILDKEHLGYSCGLWADDDATLEDSMARKYSAFAEMLEGGDKVLEVGSGFGGLSRFLVEASEYRQVHAYNLSKTQHDHCVEASTTPRLHYYNQCWTEIEGSYDAIVSDEFIVHTGVARLDFFEKMRGVIRDGGVFVLKNLSIHHSSRGCAGPSSMANLEIFGGNGNYPAYFETLANADAAGFAREESFNIPIENYVKTVNAWKERLRANSDFLKEVNEVLFFDMWRMFKLYLAMFDRGFLTIEMTKFRAI